MERINRMAVHEAAYAALAAAGRRLYEVLRARGEARGRAVAARELQGLSDHLLRDIGLHRSQIESAVRGERSWY